MMNKRKLSLSCHIDASYTCHQCSSYSGVVELTDEDLIELKKCTTDEEIEAYLYEIWEAWFFENVSGGFHLTTNGEDYIPSTVEELENEN